MALTNIESVPQRQLHVIFIVGASVSMSGPKIEAINDAILNILPMFSELSNSETMLYFNVMHFSDDSSWQYNCPTPVQDFIYKDITQLGTDISFNNCYKSLNKYLSKIHEKNSLNSLYAPIIILLTDRNSTDNPSSELISLRCNPLFNCAIKIAILIGDDVDIEALKDFTGTYNSLLNLKNIATLKNLILLKPLSNDSISNRKNYNPSSNVSLHYAISTIIAKYGKDLISDSRLINFLSDYHAFDRKATKRIMQTILQMEYGRKILELDKMSSEDKLLKKQKYISRLIQEGFQEEYVVYVINSIFYALGWEEELPKQIDD